MSENPRRQAAEAEADPEPSAPTGGGPAPETSQYELAHLLSPITAEALGSTPGELRAALALSGHDGPWTVDQIQAAVEVWRQREIPAY